MHRSPRWWAPQRDVVLILDDEDEAEAASEEAEDERTFIPLRSGSWDRRLTQREKTIRGAASVGVALVVALVLIGGPGTVLAYLGTLARTITTAPVAQAAAVRGSDTLDVPVPADISFNPQVTLTPVNGSEPFSYACWVDEDPKLLGDQSGALHVAIFAVGTHNWTLLTAPVAQSAGCTLVVDQTAPNSLVLASDQATGGSGGCILPVLYRSDDRGATWRAMSWPVDAVPVCDLQLQLEGGRLYAQADTSLIPAQALPEGAAGRLFVTTNYGMEWTSADDGLAGIADVALVALRRGGRILVQGDDPQVAGATALWQSADAGQHWSMVATVPGLHAQVFASSNPDDTSYGGWGRLYTYAAEGAGGSPLQRLIHGEDASLDDSAALATGYAAPQWTLSALQPTGAAVPRWNDVQESAEASGELPAALWHGDAGEGPSGSLMVARPDLGGKVLTVTPPFDLVLWNGTQWVVDEHTIPANAKLQGVAWDGDVMRVWVTFKPGISRSVLLLTFTISPDDVA